jgi:hypothetical protein
LKCHIWTIIENGGWDWLKGCLRDRNSRISYGYSIRRFPLKSDILIFYSGKRLHGRIIVAEGGREVTSKDIKNEPELKGYKYVMFLDGRTVRIFNEPVPADEVASQIEALKGKTGKSLHAACRNNPEISVEEYKKIVERGYYGIFKEFFSI